MTKFTNANPASRSRWPTPSCRSPTTSAMGKIIWMLGFSSRASWRKSCTARCWSIWYRLFVATLLFFLAEKLPSVIMTGVESRYFLRTNGHPHLKLIATELSCFTLRCARSADSVAESPEFLLRCLDLFVAHLVILLVDHLSELFNQGFRCSLPFYARTRHPWTFPFR